MSCPDEHPEVHVLDEETNNKMKKPKKEVSKFYRRQNELLENFKTDNEQIQKVRQSKTSLSESAKPELSSSSVRAPLLKNVDGEIDMEVVVVPPGSPLPPGTTKILKKKESSKLTEKRNNAAAQFATITLLVNVSLMLAKAVASYLSGSLSIISSLVDSLVDITSGLVISICSRMIRKRDPYQYPRGRTRLEPLSLIIISVVMGVASMQLIFDAIKRIYNAYLFDFNGEGEEPTVEMGWTTVAIMVSTVVIKLILFLICQKFKNDPSVQVLSMDHRNDCLSNSVSLICAFLAKQFCYYADPVGAICVSVYILSTWVDNGLQNISQLSGKSASQEFTNRIIKVCMDHDSRITHLDTVYVYHFGTKFLVEVHIVLDEEMRLKDAHDISETLQLNIESLPEVERAFVHPDYDYNHSPTAEHNVV